MESTGGQNEGTAVGGGGGEAQQNETNTITTTITTTTTTTTTSTAPQSSWWSSLVKTAKEKSANAIEIMRTDLAEFKSTMSADTSRLVTSLTTVDVDAAASNTTGTLFNSLSNLGTALGINTLISNVAGVINEEENEEGLVGGGGETVERKPGRVVVSPPGNVHDRFQAELKQMQSDEATFLSDATSSDYEEWAAKFNPDDVKSTISDLLIDNSAMRLIYSQLVPAQMSNSQFWARYFFKFNQLEEDYKKRVQLLEKANRSKQEGNDEANDWEDEDSVASPKSDDAESPVVEEIQQEPTTKPTHDDEHETKTKTTVSKSTEESDDWEKLSDIGQTESSQSKSNEKVAACEVIKRSPETTATIDESMTPLECVENESNSSKLSEEVEVPRKSNTTSTHQKTNDNDWEDWDE